MKVFTLSETLMIVGASLFIGIMLGGFALFMIMKHKDLNVSDVEDFFIETDEES